MAIFSIDEKLKTKEVTERYYIEQITVRNIVERYFVEPVTVTVRLVWEYIFSFIFTSDSFGIQTKDGYIVKCKDQ